MHRSMFARFHRYLRSRGVTVAEFGTAHIDGFFVELDRDCAPGTSTRLRYLKLLDRLSRHLSLLDLRSDNPAASMLPQEHWPEDEPMPVFLSPDEDVGLQATGLIGTMAALVLGLLISSAKSSFDTVDSELVHNAANIVLLDRVLARYGTETQEVRRLIKQSYGRSIQILASRDHAQIARLRGAEIRKQMEDLQRKLEELSPHTEAQRQLRASAIEIAAEVLAMRRLVLLQAVGSVPMPLLITLVLWLSVIFGAFGTFAAPNGTVIAALLLGALSASAAIFLILEMNTPLDGVIGISLAPMREALDMLGQ
ncbi:hypothetical protein Bcen2424_0153 [Burkholderia cenocepacia HI2424]|nr:hypothetical protein Bcen2424_0153 [Burkholderia cenocepacia HI2424]